MRSVGLLYVSLDSVLSSIDLDSFLASIRSKWAGELSSTHPASGSLFPYYSSVFSTTSHQASQQCFNSTVFLLGVIWKDEKHFNVLKFRIMLLDTLNLNSFGCTPRYLSLFSSWTSYQRGAVTLAHGTCPSRPNMDRARHISRAIDTLPYIKSSQGVEFHPRVWSIIGRRAGMLSWFAFGQGLWPDLHLW